MCTNTYVILYTKYGDLFEQSCSKNVPQYKIKFLFFIIYRKSHLLLDTFEFLNKTCEKCNSNWMKKE